MNKAQAKAGWYKKIAKNQQLRKVAFYGRPLADFLNRNIDPPIVDDPKGAFDYIRNHGTHIGGHLKDLGLKFDDASELLIPDTFGDFLADLVDHLLRG